MLPVPCRQLYDGMPFFWNRPFLSFTAEETFCLKSFRRFISSKTLPRYVRKTYLSVRPRITPYIAQRLKVALKISFCPSLFLFAPAPRNFFISLIKNVYSFSPQNVASSDKKLPVVSMSNYKLSILQNIKNVACTLLDKKQ